MRFAAAIVIAVGISAGVGAYAFVYARGASYLTNDAAACANCHVMHEHYSAWLKSSHRAVAVCNDCHTPSHPVAKYATKANNGFWHSFAFTTGRFPDALPDHGSQSSHCRDLVSEMSRGAGGPARSWAVSGAGPLSALSCRGRTPQMRSRKVEEVEKWKSGRSK